MKNSLRIRFSYPLALLIAFVPLLASSLLLAQETPSKVIVVLDASGSMWGEIDGEPKIEIARETIAGLLDDWNAERHIGLIAYGHREKGSCEDIELLISPAPLNKASFLSVVNGIIPKGKTPLTDAVEQAARELRYTEEAANVILVSDGEENCGKDPRAVAKMLAANGIGFTAHVIGFDVTEEQQTSLAAIAEETGGKFVAANDAASLKEALTEVVSVVETAPAPEPAPMKVASAEGPGIVNLKAVASEGGEEVKAYWSTYLAKADLEGNRERVASGSGQKLELEPGEYLTSAKWGNVTAETSFTVKPGETTDIVLVMNGGILKLTALASEGGEEVKAYYDIYEATESLSGERKRITSGTGREPIIPAGNFLITAKWGNAIATGEATVEAGSATATTLVMNAGILELSSSQVEGGEDIGAYYDVYEAKENLSGERKRITSGTGRSPILPAGDYYITGKWGNATGQTEAKVTAGAKSEANVLIPSGILLLKVVDANGQPAKAYHDVVFSEKDLEGNQKRITSGSGTELKLPVGTFDVRSKGTDVVGSVSGVEVKAGEKTEATITLKPVE